MLHHNLDGGEGVEAIPHVVVVVVVVGVAVGVDRWGVRVVAAAGECARAILDLVEGVGIPGGHGASGRVETKGLGSRAETGAEEDLLPGQAGGLSWPSGASHGRQPQSAPVIPGQAETCPVGPA